MLSSLHYFQRKHFRVVNKTKHIWFYLFRKELTRRVGIKHNGCLILILLKFTEYSKINRNKTSALSMLRKHIC